ncbi:hypothetical protein Q9966_011321 [Columba livia]|nr:hypothetical protein Q9966_011321 [Columba livia]
MQREHKPVLDPEVLGAYNLPPDLAGLTVEEAREKLRATISKQANTLNMLDYQLRQRCRARDKLQRQLQQRQRLLKEELDETKKQKQMIRQLENELDKMRAKVRAAEKVGAVYERVHDALQEEVNQLTREVALMCRTSELYEVEVKAMEAMAEEACKAAAIAQPAKDESSMDLSTQQDPLVATELEAAESQTDHEAEISEKMEAAKAAVQCLRLWNIPSKLLAQDSSLEDLENDIKEKEEDDSLLSQGVEGKFQYLAEKLQYLAQRAAHLPPERRILDESNETFVQARDFLEKNMASDPQNVMVSFEDRDSSDDESSEDRDDGDGEAGGHVPTREDIKREGQLLIERYWLNPNSGLAHYHKPVLDPEVFGAYNLPPDLAGLTVEEARDKLRATISKQANTLNMLDYQLRQRCRARDKLQRQLQQRQRLLKEELDETKKQKQMIRQLENELDKMRAKVRAAEKVGAVYERVHDALQEEVNQLTREVALMCRTSELYEVEVKAMEAMAEEACKAAAIAQPPKSESSMDLSTQQDPLVATELEAAESQTDHEAEISEKMEAAKAAVQCSRLWNIPSKLLAQDSSLEDLENDIKEKEEDDSLLSQGVEGKFQYLAEKLLYLQERAAHLPPERRILDESNEGFPGEKKMSSDPRNVMVSFEQRDSSDDESSEDRDDEDGEAGEHVPTREDIKREGQLLIESKKGAMKK